MSPNTLVTPRQLAEATHLTIAFWANLRSKGGGPRYIKVARHRVLYDMEEVMEWLEAKKISNTSETPNQDQSTVMDDFEADLRRRNPLFFTPSGQQAKPSVK